eukprot:CAMPEP_0179242492 /NCGR_PEP_ID=MMETSP0797-20121207/17046_1 /TAXON_ID=47934 /ORGANISM="Dinophysis acuminata, Strain DAEP01" /LENGTH=96 /DNA_ID=CAMNT_0020949931 /DNA_START=95 /DNA_END=382 /DNA_ORIENTATION=-
MCDRAHAMRYVPLPRTFTVLWQSLRALLAYLPPCPAACGRRQNSRWLLLGAPRSRGPRIARRRVWMADRLAARPAPASRHEGLAALARAAVLDWLV